MRIPTQSKALKQRIKKERKHKEKQIYLPEEEIKPEIRSKSPLEDGEKAFDLIADLELLKKLLKLIEEGATGFKLAYEVEKNQSIKKLIHDGIMFYNSFIEIGNQKFLDVPDKKYTNYKNFRTIENTEKYLFLIWLKEVIAQKEKLLNIYKDRKRYIKERKKAIERLKICKNCGATITEKQQIVCENCGINLK